MSRLPPPERRCRELARTVGLGVDRLTLANLQVGPRRVRVHRRGKTLAEMEGWEAVEDWLIQYICG